jgi:hypothetical protein
MNLDQSVIEHPEVVTGQAQVRGLPARQPADFSPASMLSGVPAYSNRMKSVTGSETILALLTTTPRFVAVRMRSSQGRRLSRSSSWVRDPCLARQARYSGSLGVYRSRISKCTADILVAAINSARQVTSARAAIPGNLHILAQR